jgi:transposase
MWPTIIMSEQELWRSQYIERYVWGTLIFTELLSSIWVGERQWRRIVEKYRRDWPKSLMHGLRWKPSNHKASSLLYDQVKKIITEQYSSFWPTFVHEKLQENHHITLSDETVRHMMTELWFWKPRNRRKESPPFHLRERKECYGVMTQFDGTYHIWLPDILPGEYWCLLVAIDDATSQIVDAFFCNSEGIENIFPFWRNYIETYGVPQSIYTDRFSTYKNNHPESADIPTQFGRVCASFWIDLIFALTPQAKGRVERVNRTLQDRLVAEMKLINLEAKKKETRDGTKNGIKDEIKKPITNIDEANKFLKEVYIPKHNKKFAVLPASETNMHRELRLEEKEQLETIFSIHSIRKIMNDYTISFQNQLYQLHAGWAMVFRWEQVRVEERIWTQGFTGEIVITQREKKIPSTKILKRPEKGYKDPLPPRKTETGTQDSQTSKLSYLERTGKQHPYMRNFSFWRQSGMEENKVTWNKKELLVATQLVSP